MGNDLIENNERGIEICHIEDDSFDPVKHGYKKVSIGKLKRLDHLIPELKDLVDKGVIALMPAYELSFLPVKLQKSLWKTIEYDQCTPSHSQAIRMRRLNEEGALTPELIDSIMDEIKPNQKDKLVLRDQETIAQIPADIPEYRREEYVAKALRLFRKIGGK